MVRFVLVSLDKSKAVYDYFPEGKDKKGTIEWDIENKKTISVALAEGDENRNYAMHVFSKLRKAEKDNMPEQGMEAWY